MNHKKDPMSHQRSANTSNIREKADLAAAALYAVKTPQPGRPARARIEPVDIAAVRGGNLCKLQISELVRVVHVPH